MRPPALILAAFPLAISAIDVSAQTASAPIIVTVTNKGCEPNELTVPAGTVTFQIINKGSRALEWEILKGVMVVDERENIAPGFRQKLTTKLEPGDYEITCGLLSNPRGKLTVRGDGGATIAGKPSPMELIGPVAEYRVWLASELSALRTKTNALSASSGNVESARSAWLETHAAYLQLEPIFPLIADAAAPVSASFSRVEAVLFADTPKVDALAAEVATLAKDIATFQLRARPLTPTPDALLAGASATAQTLVASLGPATAVSSNALADADARLKGITRIAELFAPLAARADRPAGERIAASLGKAKAALQSKTAPAAMTADERAQLIASTSPLPRELTALTSILGL